MKIDPENNLHRIRFLAKCIATHEKQDPRDMLGGICHVLDSIFHGGGALGFESCTPRAGEDVGLLGAVLAGAVGATIPKRAQFLGTFRWIKGISLTLDARGGIALFVIVLFWWTGSASPVPTNRDKGLSE